MVHYKLHTVFCFHANVLGSDQHLIVADDGKQGCWSDDVPDQVLVFTGEYKRDLCLDTVIRLSAGTASFVVPDRYVRAATTILGTTVGRPLWRNIMPRSVFESAARHLVSGVVDSYSQDAARYYASTWALVSRFLDGLQQFTIDGVPGVHAVTYDRLRTRTGRMVVASGPPIMTMPRDTRHSMRSVTGGRLKYVDFRALEPTIVANVVGAQFSGSDLYAWLSNNVLHGRDRNATKLATVQALYGGAYGRSAEAQRIASWFCVHDLAQRIRATARGHIIINVYGRSILSETFDDDGCIINDYVQSSAVDAAMVGFDTICSDHGVTPVAVIHDAVIVDDASNSLPDGFIGSTTVNGVGILYYKVTDL